MKENQPKRVRLPMAVAVPVAIGLYVFGSLAYSVISSFTSFPDYAKEDVVYSKYSELIEAIDMEVANSDTVFDLAAKLEKFDYPADVVYSALKYRQRDEDKVLEVLQRDAYGESPYSTFLIGDAGYGTTTVNGEKKTVVIISRRCANAEYLDRYIIYMER